MYIRYFKRLLDIVLSIFIIIVILPIILFISLLVFILIGRPVFFIQSRIGLQNRPFQIIKFRTMKNSDIENNTTDEERITKLGAVLRKLSIDELPELINIFIGDMSFVGPRPLLTEYLPLYNDIQKRRHDVRPGLTGLAQIKGRNSLSWSEKFEYDNQYIENITFLGDLKIIFKTIVVVFRREGISSSTSVTMEKFDGNN